MDIENFRDLSDELIPLFEQIAVTVSRHVKKAEAEITVNTNGDFDFSLGDNSWELSKIGTDVYIHKGINFYRLEA